MTDRETKPEAIVARVNRLVEAEWVVTRRDFMHKAGALKTAAARAHAYGGSAYGEAAHGLCATELNRRISWTLDKFFETHAAMSASPSYAHRRACKEWVAMRIAGEAEDLQQHLGAHPDLARPGGEFVLDNLNGDAQRERESAYARIDSEFDKLQRAWTERWSRWLVRSLRAGLAFFGLGAAFGKLG